MRNIRVWREGDRIYSEEIREEETEKGYIKMTRTSMMDDKMAKTQLGWIEKELEKATSEVKQAKHNITPAGRQNLLNLERQKLQQAKEQKKDMENLKEQYDKALKD